MPLGTTEDAYWHYEFMGTRKGPVDSLAMQNLLQKTVISASTLVWRPGFDDWIELGRSELKHLLPQNIPPPLSGARVNNTYVWILAFAPILGGFLEAIVAGMITGSDSPVVIQAAMKNLWWITVMLNILLLVLDERRIRAAGHDTKSFSGTWLFLVPLYLFKRAKYLKQNPAYAWIWLVMVLISIAGS